MTVHDELFEVCVSEESAGVALTLKGELDVATSQILLGYVTDAFARGCSRIILNIKELSFVDSTGLWVFITATKRAIAEKKQLVISMPPRHFMQLVELSGLEEFFDFAS